MAGRKMPQTATARCGASASSARGVAGPRHAFTLVELVVVIGIIVILVGIVLSAGAALSRRAQVNEAESALHILDAATREWEHLAGRKTTWWQQGDDAAQRHRADIHSDTAEVFIISELLDVIARSSDVKSILAQIPQERIYIYRKNVYPDWVDTNLERRQLDERFAGSRTVLDPWGTPIYATHFGRPWVHTDGYWGLQRDPDGTIRTYNEDKYGVAPNRTIVFVSAGPDRRFGIDEEFADLFSDKRAQAKRAARQDNVYSAPVQFDNP